MGRFFNRGSGRDHKQPPKLDEQTKHRIQAQSQSTMLSSAAKNNQIDVRYLKEITNHSLQEGTYEHLASLLSPNFVLSQLEREESTELKWLTRAITQIIYSFHPPEDSYMTGDYRAFIRDDPDDSLEPLTAREKLTIQQTTMTVIARMKRSEGGWQQDKMNESITRSEVSTDREEKKRSLNPFK